MAKIHVLDDQTIDQIAAGEVIERPVSVVKELVENSLDAGATAVEVEIRGGGIELIRVSDNGCGIPAEEVPTAFARHATSKITDAEDLFALHSLGFRGEALSSIASVARVELITKTAEEEAGCRYIIEGGTVLSEEAAPAPVGTTFIVRDLFFNTPVRRKFLKSAQTETSYVATLMEQLCLSRAGVSMSLVADGRTKLRIGGSYQMKDVLFTLYGRETAEMMRPLDYEEKGIRVFGYIGLPTLCRGNRSMELTFVNGRFIKSPLLMRAIEQAYHGLTMQHKFPVAVLQISMDASLLDVNVHPTKMEVRFRQEKEIFDVVYHAIRETLFAKDLIPEVKAEEKPEKKAEMPVPPEGAGKPGTAAAPETAKKADKASQTENQAPAPEKPVPDEMSGLVKAKERVMDEAERAAGTPDAAAVKPFAAEIPVPAEHRAAEPIRDDRSAYREEKDRRLLEQLLREEIEYPAKGGSAAGREEARIVAPTQKAEDFRLIGQVFETYWLMEYKGWLLIADQHAVHEKILFERTMKSLETRTVTVQQLLPPMLLTLNAAQQLTYSQYADSFAKLGFEIEALGGREIAVSGIPDNLFGLDQQSLFLEMLDELADDRSRTPNRTLEAKVAMMSCKAAVKGNQKLSFAEAEALLKELLTLDNPYACPHGRPTMIRFSETELEKKFKRIV
ncbi:MAG: DNA mismatch repair endonuclease MutL [Lachnospiraceae bacterium]|nr:DNA mismatch repair endonuclease MutL [Lachnospiraceae bacterium]